MELRFSLLNINGLVTKRNNKLNSEEIRRVFESSDVVLFTETWGHSYCNFEYPNFESFILNRRDIKKGAKRKSGGIILYLRNEYVTRETLVYTSEDDILWIKISKSVLSLKHDLYVALLYALPEASSRQSMIETNIFDRLLDSVAHIETKTESQCNLLICGDFNSRTSTNNDFVIHDDSLHMSVLPDEYISDNFLSRYSQDKGHVNNNGLLLLDFCKQTGVRIMNGRVGKDNGIGKYTFIGSRGSSVIDYVLASEDLFRFVKDFEVQDPNILSDHCIINFSFEFNRQPSLFSENEEYEKVSGKYVWDNDFKDEYKIRLQGNLTGEKLASLNVKISNSESNGDIDSCLSDFVSIIEDISTPVFKKTKQLQNTETILENANFCYKKENPWYNEECNNKKFYFLHMLNNYREAKTNENRIGMVKARSEYKSLLRKCRYEYDKNKTYEFVNAKYKNAKLYWNLLKESAGVKPSNVALSSFEQYFKAVNNPSEPFFSPDEDILYFNERYENNEFCIMFDELNIQISQEEVIKSIKQLKTNKSGGPDKLINEFFIHGKDILGPTLCNLFNKVFECGYFPEEWSVGYVIPLHKKGSRSDVENYRGINLLSALGKLFTRIINNRLSDWAENYFILIEAQAGFRPGMGTVDNIFVLHGLISHILNQGKKLYCAFIDFSKAFDYVVRENLWYKMIKLGLRGKILNIIKSMYASVKSRVKFCNNLGNEFYCSLGVRQGECLSPLLFSLYLNDLEEQFVLSDLNGLDVNTLKLFLLLYADDIVIFANTSEELQVSLNLLAEYCEKWKLTINTSKTKVMVFRKGGILPRNLVFNYNGTPLEIVTSFKYLGIVFTAGGSFSEAQTTLAGQAQKAIFTLNKYLYKFTFISPKHKLELFDKLVTPILNYGCEVWGFFQANSVERVHMQFCKQILGVKKATQNDFVYGELGRTNYITRRYLIIVKFWLKLLVRPENKYIRIVYDMMVNDIEIFPNKVNWASLVRHLLLSLGFYEVWLNQGVGDCKRFLSVFSQRLTDIFIQNWRSRLEDSSRANFYKTFATFQFQPYLEAFNIYKFSQAISKLRVSSHRLAIESGRWARPNSIPINERKCSICLVLEDEFHFILECQLYVDLRKSYIDPYYWKRASMFKFLELITTTNQNKIRKLGVFIYKALELRNDIVYRNT